MLQQFVEQIRQAVRVAHSETGLQIRLEPILVDLLGRFNVPYNPAANETLKSLGLSQVDSSRPDSLFGHVVLDYKTPGLLSSPRELIAAKKQIEGYLDGSSHGADWPEARAWSGILWDGESLCFCHSDGKAWVWTPVFEVSEASLLTLVTTYRALQRKPLTAPFLARAFGKESDVARNLLSVMCSHLSKPRHRTTMLFREWKRLFEQVSTYGLDQLPALKKWAKSQGIATKDASQILFAIHSHYALVVKLLTSELLAAVSPLSATSLCERIANASTIDETYRSLAELEDGEYWRRYRISNFLEGDFFSWYTNERSRALAEAVQAVAREFMQFEPATAVVRPEDIRDLLKEFYTTLVDEQIRHDLGEYYTPDWLAQRVLDRVGYDGSLQQSVLDPACGSGTFLVECILRMRLKANGSGHSRVELLNTILRRIKGLDLNPLAVISARANFILTIADLVFTVAEDVELPIYLADSVNVPVETHSGDGLRVLEFSLDTELGRYEFEIPSVLIESRVLGKILLACEDAVKEKRSLGSFLQSIKGIPNVRGLLDERVEKRLDTLFTLIQQLDENDWNRIWCRILKNNFSPNGFGQVDILIGNPPWVRWSRLPRTYRERVKHFCQYYGLVSGRGYSGGIESDISTVVLFSASDHWLKTGGKVGLLITWPVFKSASARGFRLGTLPGDQGLHVDEIANLTQIQPFPDATNETAIYIATKVQPSSAARFNETKYESWFAKRGSRVGPRLSLQEVLRSTDVVKGVACPVGEWGSPLWTGDTESFKESSVMRGQSPYVEAAHRGTISDLARVYWVKVERYSSDTDRALIRSLREDELPVARSIEDPAEGVWIEAELLYPLVRGRDLGRYSVSTDGWYQIVPNKHYESMDTEEEFADKYPLAYSYFSNYRDLLERRSTYRRFQRHLPFYVIYCVGPYTFRKWKLAWMEQQAPAAFRCSVLSDLRGSIVPNKRAVPDHKLYFADLESESEAHFLCAYLNSHPVRTWLGGFLHGKQIATSIFQFMRVPKFDEHNADHQRLTAISVEAHRTRRGDRYSGPLASESEEELAELVRHIASSQ
jgi:hypothetical protein